MALTTTEENQLRELLRRMNATRNGKTANQLNIGGNADADFVIASKDDRLSRVGASELGIRMVRSNVGTDGANLTTASATYNHLMTRDATRSEITRMTSNGIAANGRAAAAAQSTANTANGNALNAQNRVGSIETWKTSTVTPELQRRYKAIGGVFANNPGIQVGALNQPGVGIGPRTHRFAVPMAENPLILFSLYGDVNYPRFELINENGKITGFTLFHQPTAGLWMAVGTPA
nr:MAG TPA: hypothetical protein [Caudoviricetes sp.]